MQEKQHYSQPKGIFGIVLNQWDVLILLVFFGVMAAIVWGTKQMVSPYHLGETINISLDPMALPGYSIRTVLRMFIALLFSLLFTFTFGTLAAKSKRAERIIIPFIDIMQSVPILGFLSIALIAFIYLFPGRLLGPETAAIFAIFTSQVWNMALSFYQSLKTVPKEMLEASRVFQLGPWQRFWRVEVPFAIPSLLWNTMISLSAGWFFVVASEAFSISTKTITLPGIGSYISLATQQSNYLAIIYAIIAMFLVILLYDQLLFRPLMIWAEKFKINSNDDVGFVDNWFLNLLQRTHLNTYFEYIFEKIKNIVVTPKKPFYSRKALPPKVVEALSWTTIALIQTFIFLSIILSIGFLIHFIYTSISLIEIGKVFYYGFITAIKIGILVVLTSLIWVPIGVWIGLRPKVSAIIQPVLQILAAFPANILYPVMFMLIMSYQLNVNIWSSPLMILGTQWYILFNVIAGASALSKEIHMVTKNYGVKGWLWWRKVMLPGIFPYYITGAITAAGGCWNASIIADVITWGDNTIQAIGLGGYITESFRAGDFPRLALGIAVMSVYVLLINRVVWRKFYQLAEMRYNTNV